MSDIKWNGSGIPPVGTVCEYKLNESEHWFECEIKYVFEGLSDDEGCFVAWCPHLEVDQFFSFGSGKYSLYLRPRKTPEQIEAENRHHAVVAMMGILGSRCALSRYSAEVLYDAGYRKTEVNK